MTGTRTTESASGAAVDNLASEAPSVSEEAGICLCCKMPLAEGERERRLCSECGFRITTK